MQGREAIMNGSMQYQLGKPSKEELSFAGNLRKRAVVRRPRIVYLTGTESVSRELKREMERLGIGASQIADRSGVAQEVVDAMLDGGAVRAQDAMKILRAVGLNPTTLPTAYFKGAS